MATAKSSNPVRRRPIHVVVETKDAQGEPIDAEVSVVVCSRDAGQCLTALTESGKIGRRYLELKPE